MQGLNQTPVPAGFFPKVSEVGVEMMVVPPAVIRMSSVYFPFRQLWVLIVFRTEGRNSSTRRHNHGSIELEIETATWPFGDLHPPTHTHGEGVRVEPRVPKEYL